MSREQDARVAELVMGWTAYAEQRGKYRLAVVVSPGDRPPWMKTRDPEPERYEQIGAVEAVKMGFFGIGFPEYTRDPGADYTVLERVRGWGRAEQDWFYEALGTIWVDERRCDELPALAYQPGDYARAALAVVEGRADNERTNDDGSE